MAPSTQILGSAFEATGMNLLPKPRVKRIRRAFRNRRRGGGHPHVALAAAESPPHPDCDRRDARPGKRPNNTDEGGFHEITVEVAGSPEVRKVLTRPGYWLAPKQ
jgi:hypothetical protein